MGPAAAPAAAPVRVEIARDLAQVTLFGREPITRDQLEVACGTLGVSMARGAMTTLVTELPMAFGDLWPRVARLKSEAQWRMKMRSICLRDKVNDGMGKAEVGHLVYQHFLADGEVATEPQQEPPN